MIYKLFPSAIFLPFINFKNWLKVKLKVHESGSFFKKMCLESEQDQGEMLRCCVGQKANVILPSSVEARSWVASLDKLLESSYGTALFRAFLQREYAEENLDFVIKVERYREISAKKREREAWKMYRTYIAIGAPHELNLDILSRKVTDLAMITPHVSTFDTAQRRVVNLLQNDAYPRFLRWSVYLRLAYPELYSTGGLDTE